MLTIFYLFALCLLATWMFHIVKHYASLVTIAVLLLMVGLSSTYYHVEPWGWLVMTLLIDGYLLFYIEDYLNYKRFVCMEFLIFIGSWLLSTVWNTNIFPCVFLLLSYFLVLYLQQRVQPLIMISLLIFFSIFAVIGLEKPFLLNSCFFLLVWLLENLQHQYRQSLDYQTVEFQNQVMTHHYEEVKSVYLNMRGWRHDYHNHIQSMKAYLTLKQFSQLETYLQELESDLIQVDQLVKSGNLMVDAILNAKLSLAKEHQIQVTCKAMIPEEISIADMDICVIVGNLLDNAIEACDKLAIEKRMIRVYTDIVNQQFYFSITNSAIENLSEGQRKYISEKRGNHGHGMKRVKLTVDKYDGYLNLKNEPGVFVSELMIPLK